jgi:hypothetical protein
MAHEQSALRPSCPESPTVRFFTPAPQSAVSIERYFDCRNFLFHLEENFSPIKKPASNGSFADAKRKSKPIWLHQNRSGRVRFNVMCNEGWETA